VLNTKVVPNTLIYFYKTFHIFLRSLSIFPKFLSTPVLNRNPFEKNQKPKFLRGPDPLHRPNPWKQTCPNPLGSPPHDPAVWAHMSLRPSDRLPPSLASPLVWGFLPPNHFCTRRYASMPMLTAVSLSTMMPGAHGSLTSRLQCSPLSSPAVCHVCVV
jgi:hypothetical protein